MQHHRSASQGFMYLLPSSHTVQHCSLLLPMLFSLTHFAFCLFNTHIHTISLTKNMIYCIAFIAFTGEVFFEAIFSSSFEPLLTHCGQNLGWNRIRCFFCSERSLLISLSTSKTRAYISLFLSQKWNTQFCSLGTEKPFRWWNRPVVLWLTGQHISSWTELFLWENSQSGVSDLSCQHDYTKTIWGCVVNGIFHLKLMFSTICPIIFDQATRDEA